jgi:hypothetical protein
MTCPHCGEWAPEQAWRCPNCGQLLPAAEEPTITAVGTLAGDSPVWPEDRYAGQSQAGAGAHFRPSIQSGVALAAALIAFGTVGLVVFAFLALTALNSGHNNGTTLVNIPATSTATTLPSPTPSPSPAPSPTTMPTGGNDVVAIAAGGQQIGNFSADMDVSGGATDSTSNPIDTSGVTDPAPQQVYQSERWGNFTYVIPSLTPGTAYKVRLHFAEIYFQQAGQRVFNVSINGQPVLPNFDIIQQAGAPNKAIVEEFTVQADDSGQITISFTQGPQNYPKVSGIEIVAVG